MVQAISEPDQRDASLKQFFRIWKKQDAPAALRWLQTEGPEAMREGVTRR
jgi:hypothetical protein